MIFSQIRHEMVGTLGSVFVFYNNVCTIRLYIPISNLEQQLIISIYLFSSFGLLNILMFLSASATIPMLIQIIYYIIIVGIENETCVCL